MIETACELTEGRINGNEIRQIIGFGREMLTAPINLLDGVRETIHELSNRYELMLITKGDLFDQETKLARSGIGDYFKTVEIVSQKNAHSYQKILNRYQIKPDEFVMIGNSLRSDILPVLEIGANAVHVEYETEWTHEKVSESELKGKEFPRLKQMSEVIDWLKLV